MISPNLSTPHIPSPPEAPTNKGAISALLASPASSTTSSADEAAAAASEAATHLAEKVQAAAAEIERSKAAAAIKMSNFSIAALINKDSEAELERRRRLVESVPMLGKSILLRNNLGTDKLAFTISVTVARM